MTTSYRQADWKEPLIFEHSKPGRLGHMLPELEPELVTEAKIGDLVPEELLRTEAAGLPEVGEMQVLRHYVRLSQMNYGVNAGKIYPLGSCTMKYNPIINELMAGHPKMAGQHPL